MKKEVGVEREEDLKTADFKAKGVEAFLKHLNDSIPLMIQKARSSDKFMISHHLAESGRPSTRRKVPYRYWNSLENQKRFVEEVGKELKIMDGEMEKWYSVTPEIFSNLGGNSLLRKYYPESFYGLLKTIYPSYDFLPWKFCYHVPKEVWTNPTVIAKAVSYIERELNIKERLEWRRVNAEKLRRLRVMYIFRVNGGVESVVERFSTLPK